jgi:hypothetical protein
MQPSPKLTAHGADFVGGSSVQIARGDDEGALFRLRSENRSEVGAGKPRPSPPRDRASAKPSDSPVQPAHAEFVAALAGCPPRPIPIDADPLDLDDRADHLSKVLSALSAYVALVLDDTAQNVPGGLDLPDAEGILADLAADLIGPIQHAADVLAGRIA